MSIYAYRMDAAAEARQAAQHEANRHTWLMVKMYRLARFGDLCPICFRQCRMPQQECDECERFVGVCCSEILCGENNKQTLCHDCISD